MPHKFNAARRHKFDKVQYRVINYITHISMSGLTRREGAVRLGVSVDTFVYVLQRAASTEQRSETRLHKASKI